MINKLTNVLKLILILNFNLFPVSIYCDEKDIYIKIFYSFIHLKFKLPSLSDILKQIDINLNMGGMYYFIYIRRPCSLVAKSLVKHYISTFKIRSGPIV